MYFKEELLKEITNLTEDFGKMGNYIKYNDIVNLINNSHFKSIDEVDIPVSDMINKYPFKFERLVYYDNFEWEEYIKTTNCEIEIVHIDWNNSGLNYKLILIQLNSDGKSHYELLRHKENDDE